MSGDTLVSVGSPPSPFPQNKQNEPALAVDPNHPDVLVAGANDEIDLESGAAGDPTTAPFTPGVGFSGVYFSFDSGATWTQPTYTGWTARDQLGPAPSTPYVGRIGTLPKYYENGLVSNGDPALAFGPMPGPNGTFSWNNGSRLYYANLAANFPGEGAFKGFEAVAVSRTDEVAAAAANNQNAWMDPVIVSKQSSATFSDKEQIWADNAASSPFFGNVYVAFAKFQDQFHTQAIVVARSTDGGDTWSQTQVTPASNNAQIFGRSGATIRTDSAGVIYLFYLEFGKFSTQGQVGTQMMVRSFDGGVTWTRPRAVETVVQPGIFDPVQGHPVMDGIAGARVDLAAAPSVDIANGAPTGADATNEIVVTWANARAGLNDEHALLISSTDGGSTWSSPISIETGATDRPFYTAPALSPDGTDLYVVYNAFTTPYRTNTFDPRSLVGVVLHTDIVGGVPTRFTELHRGVEGDPRGSSTNNLTSEFLGDYVSAVATRTYGAAVWNDVRNAADSRAIDTYRQSVVAGSPGPRPNLMTAVQPTFGNSDIYGGSFPDPTPTSALATSLVTSQSLGASRIQPLTDIAMAFVPIPDVSPEVQFVTPKGRKRSTPLPAVDVQ